MSDVELRDELITLLSAGHETTAVALTLGRRVAAGGAIGEPSTWRPKL